MKKPNLRFLLILFISSFLIIEGRAQQSNAGKALPEITTLPIVQIGIDSAISGGKIISDGGQTITSSGICISKNPFPTVNDRVIPSGLSSGEFTSQIKQLNHTTAYYVRAYATNASGTAYGVQRTFATDPIKMGMTFAGGTFFYELKPGDPGYIAGEFHGFVYLNGRPENIQIIWHNAKDTLTNATDSTLGNGGANTDQIVTIQGAGNYAASKAYNMVYNGYSDWYLPNLKEMRLITSITSSPCSSNCWTSNEHSLSQAISFINRKQTISNKSAKYKAVFIRKF